MPQIILWRDNLPAQVHWEDAPDGWYVTFASVDHPALAFRLIAKLREAWRNAEKPSIWFHYSPDNQAMGRLAGLLGAVSVGGNLHRLVSLAK